jgi:hypothetical protein
MTNSRQLRAGQRDQSAAAQILEQLEIEHDVREVMVAYMRACDLHDPDAVVQLFHADATWESLADGTLLEGGDAIYSAYSEACARLTFCVHFLTNEQISVSADAVTAKWSYFEPATNRGELAVWTAGRYEHDFECRDGRWKFLRFRIEPVLASPYNQGWEIARKVPLE